MMLSTHRLAVVGNFVAVKAAKNHEVQQHSTSGPQRIQYQSVRNNKFQQASIRGGIWFGTRWSAMRRKGMVGFVLGKSEGANDAKAGRTGRLSPGSWISRNLDKIEGRFAPAPYYCLCRYKFYGHHRPQTTAFATSSGFLGSGNFGGGGSGTSILATLTDPGSALATRDVRSIFSCPLSSVPPRISFAAISDGTPGGKTIRSGFAQGRTPTDDLIQAQLNLRFEIEAWGFVLGLVLMVLFLLRFWYRSRHSNQEQLS